MAQTGIIWVENGIYKIDGLSHFDLSGDPTIDVQDKIKTELDRIMQNDWNFFQDVPSFLNAWMQRYQNRWSNNSRWYETRNRLWFELYYVNVDPKSEHHQIQTDSGFPHNWISLLGRPNPILLAADGNELYDQHGYMNVWVNNVTDSSVYVYRWIDLDQEDEEIPYSQVSNPLFRKQFSNDKHFYVWDRKEDFPFDSTNILKATWNIWHMIWISPNEVYQWFESLWFVWPDKK